MKFFYYSPAGFVQDESIELVPEEQPAPQYEKAPEEHDILHQGFNLGMPREQFDRIMRQRARRLVREGKMVSESEFWQAVYEVRRRFAPKIRRAQREHRENEAQMELELVN